VRDWYAIQAFLKPRDESNPQMIVVQGTAAPACATRWGLCERAISKTPSEPFHHHVLASPIAAV